MNAGVTTLRMNGQWVGQYAGTNTGTLVLDLDDLVTRYAGVGYAWDDDPASPMMAARVEFPKVEGTHAYRLPLIPINPNTMRLDTIENVAPLYPGFNIPTDAAIAFAQQDDHLSIAVETNLKTSINALLDPPPAPYESALVPLANVSTWEAYKQYVTALEYRQFVFRGQSKPWRLRTAFHRSGRADIERFQSDDVAHLHRHISSLTRHVFNLPDPQEYGAFLALVQHHGYPTPLMDWSYSPFVAAFFAYHHIRKADAATSSPEDRVRILKFDKERWRRMVPQIGAIRGIGPHVSLFEPLAIENARMIPQQALSMVTSVDDIERHVRRFESPESAPYFEAIELPVTERERVMRELSIMGITAGSLFPGLDGACEELRERLF